jgi:hypothetical protein
MGTYLFCSVAVSEAGVSDFVSAGVSEAGDSSTA